MIRVGTLPRLLWLGGRLLFACSIRVYAEPAPTPEAYVRFLDAAMGSVDLMGRPRLMTPILDPADSPDPALCLRLVHDLSTDISGKVRTVWRVEGIQSAIVPAEEGRMVWTPLSGSAVSFEDPKGKTAIAAGGVRILKRTPNNFDIYGRDGGTWYYTNGLLASGTLMHCGAVRFHTIGGLLERVTVERAGGQSEIALRIRYDEMLRPATVICREKTVAVLEWEDDGRIHRLRRHDGRLQEFDYEGGLLSRLQDGGTSRYFAWQNNDSFRVADEAWAPRLHLREDEGHVYRYEMSWQGIRVERRAKATGNTVVTIHNPKTGNTQLLSTTHQLTYTFVRRGPGAGLLQSVVDNRSGQAVEYRYDDAGRSVRADVD